MSNKSSNKPQEQSGFESEVQPLFTLLLFNDDFNLYEFVIDSLVEVCKHNRLQAEQCTLIAHHKGKCEVKTGSFDALEPLKDELLRRGLSATIVDNN